MADKVVVKIANEQEYKDAISSTEILVVDFYADWCGPCRMIDPLMEEFAAKVVPQIELAKTETDEQVTDKVAIKFIKVDVDAFQELSATAGVTAMPTIMIFKDGEIIKTVVGANMPSVALTVQETVKDKFNLELV